MDERERFKFGNPDQKGLMIRRSERPIEKAEINSDIRNFIYEKLPNKEEFLCNFNFEMEFVCYDTSEVIIKIRIKFRGGIDEFELKLTGSDVKKFIDLIDSAQL